MSYTDAQREIDELVNTMSDKYKTLTKEDKDKLMVGLLNAEEDCVRCAATIRKQKKIMHVAIDAVSAAEHDQHVAEIRISKIKDALASFYEDVDV